LPQRLDVGIHFSHDPSSLIVGWWDRWPSRQVRTLSRCDPQSPVLETSSPVMDQLPLSRAYSQRIHKQRLIRAVANLFPKDSPISPFPPARAGVMHTCTSLSLSAARGAHDEPNRCILQNRHPQHSPIWQGWYIRPFPHRSGSGLYHPYSPAASFEVAYICRRSLAAQRATLHNSRRFSPAPSQKEAGSGKMWKRAKNLPLLLTGLKNDPNPFVLVVQTAEGMPGSG